MSDVTEYRRFHLVQYRFNYEGIMIFGWTIQTAKCNAAWYEKLDKLDFPVDLLLGGGSSIFFATKKAYLNCILDEEITWHERNALERIFGTSYNWKDIVK